mmetsp:Transcript_33009/g.76051  ORF Transcript_33009/g.76051 Transcript_33009/m.76051 type:complete len:530 (-) Transcript_33009:318-1907(-)
MLDGDSDRGPTTPPAITAPKTKKSQIENESNKKISPAGGNSPLTEDEEDDNSNFSSSSFSDNDDDDDDDFNPETDTPHTAKSKKATKQTPSRKRKGPLTAKNKESSTKAPKRPSPKKSKKKVSLAIGPGDEGNDDPIVDGGSDRGPATQKKKKGAGKKKKAQNQPPPAPPLPDNWPCTSSCPAYPPPPKVGHGDGDGKEEISASLDVQEETVPAMGDDGPGVTDDNPKVEEGEAIERLRPGRPLLMASGCDINLGRAAQHVVATTLSSSSSVAGERMLLIFPGTMALNPAGGVLGKIEGLDKINSEGEDGKDINPLKEDEQRPISMTMTWPEGQDGKGGGGRALILEGRRVVSKGRFMVLTVQGGSTAGTGTKGAEVKCRDIFSEVIVFGTAKWKDGDEMPSSMPEMIASKGDGDVAGQNTSWRFHVGGSSRANGGEFAPATSKDRASASSSINGTTAKKIPTSNEQKNGKTPAAAAIDDGDKTEKGIRRSYRSSAAENAKTVNYEDLSESGDETSFKSSSDEEDDDFM